MAKKPFTMPKLPTSTSKLGTAKPAASKPPKVKSGAGVAYKGVHQQTHVSDE